MVKTVKKVLRAITCLIVLAAAFLSIFIFVSSYRATISLDLVEVSERFTPELANEKQEEDGDEEKGRIKNTGIPEGSTNNEEKSGLKTTSAAEESTNNRVFEIFNDGGIKITASGLTTEAVNITVANNSEDAILYSSLEGAAVNGIMSDSILWIEVAPGKCAEETYEFNIPEEFEVEKVLTLSVPGADIFHAETVDKMYGAPIHIEIENECEFNYSPGIVSYDQDGLIVYISPNKTNPGIFLTNNTGKNITVSPKIVSAEGQMLETYIRFEQVFSGATRKLDFWYVDNADEGRDLSRIEFSLCVYDPETIQELFVTESISVP